jgi:hypothetical protein
MRHRNENEFKEAIAETLNSVDLYFTRECLISGGRFDANIPYDPKLNLYADFYIWGKERAIIECKLKPSAATIARGLGQCLLYRHKTGAKHIVLCMPEFYKFDWGFNYWDWEHLCKKYDIGFATEENLLDVLKSLAGSFNVFSKRSQQSAWPPTKATSYNPID